MAILPQCSPNEPLSALAAGPEISTRHLMASPRAQGPTRPIGRACHEIGMDVDQHGLEIPMP